jgi:glucose/arabinose dehydrogenase
MNLQSRGLVAVWILFAACSSSNDTDAKKSSSSTGEDAGARSSAGAAAGKSSAGGSGRASAAGGSGAGRQAPASGGRGHSDSAAGSGSDGQPVSHDEWFEVPAKCGAASANASIGNACPGSPPPAIKLTELATGLVGPTYVLQAPGDSSRLYVTEQLGPVRVVKDGALQPEPLFDLRDIAGAAINNDRITSDGYTENGLLNMVFHPKFETNHKFYVSYTKSGPLFALAEFTMRDDFTVDVTTYKEIGTFPQYAFRDGFSVPLGTENSTNHVGSMMEFGPDGCLYVSRGEGGGENDARKTGQNTSDTESSILRIDLDNFSTAPAGNLAGLVWSYGFRNPWRFSFDRVTGDMYIGDVGQDQGSGFEEVNVEPRGLVGKNYGWAGGLTAGPNAQCSSPDGCRKPAVSYPITTTQNSVIGGYVYRGQKIPGLVGRYVWADWTEREIKTFVYKGENADQPEICDEYTTGVVVPTKVRSLGQGLDGEIYLVAGGAPTAGLTSAGNDEAGTLYRIDPL